MADRSDQVRVVSGCLETPRIARWRSQGLLRISGFRSSAGVYPLILLAPGHYEVSRSMPAGAGRRRRWVGRLIVVAGILVTVSGLLQPIKAAVGHHLLQSTFDARLSATEADQSDADQWRPWPGADVAPVAELHFPTLGQDRVVLDSASGEALAWGVGHVPGTAALGQPGVAAVAGHRDGRFELLGDLHEGDRVELTTLDGETVPYLIESRTVVDSRLVELPIDHGGPSELLLTTCWPIDGLISGPERLILQARPIAAG